MNSSSDKKARDIIKLSRQHICRYYSIFMDAVYNLEQVCDKTLETPMTTDGMNLYYHPDLLCILHDLEGIEAISLGIMHLCAHCVLGHIPARNWVKSTELFDALADYKVHKMLSILLDNKEYMKSVKQFSSEVRLDYEYEPLHIAYKQLLKNQRAADNYLEHAEQMEVDDHKLWHRKKPDSEGDSDGKGKGNGNGQQSIQYVTMLKWKGIKRKMEKESYFFAGFEKHDYGDEMGQQLFEYEMDAESITDYKVILEDFLKKSILEVENPNTIDPVWYHFGIDYLDEIPLIEPVEEDDCPTDGTLLLAIDTSGSCVGELCHRFLGELNNLMEQLQAMGSLSRVVLYQCDMMIHEELVMNSPEEWKNMVDTFQVKGGGGTSFCPVFEEGEKYHDVVGLIYLSDAYGDFPAVPPDYPTLFLLTEDECGGCGYVPNWIETAYF